MEYSGMKEIVWGVWKERENMNADMKWLDNPELFKVNQLESHSDHCYYLDYSDMKKEKNPLLQSLNGQWEFALKSVTSTRCIRGKEKSTTEEPIAWRQPEQKKECFQRHSTIR